MKKRLVTSALPYVNNIPHLGNLIQVLSADVFARFCRMSGYETLYVCGTDEYGTATETKAREEGRTPRELCDHYNAIHNEIYRWFNIDFDHFGRTSTPQQTEIVQDIFKKVEKAGFITEHTIEQLYSEQSQMFLADRYVRGTCPHCGYIDARGDQCESCGKLLEPTELIDPKSFLDGTTPVIRQTTHLYINLPALKDRLEEWMKKASVKGRWARNAIQMTQSWIRDGLKERAITRDLKWGIPVPRPGFESKVFYVWFDAPIGYISISAEHTPDWKKWWQNPDEVELFQFIGKDNIPFHTVIFPCSQLASGDNWTMLHHMSSTEYLNYEGGKFSKSKGNGVFGTDAKDTGIPADVWRFYIFYNRPETSDYNFTWADFQTIVNKELIGNFGNLVNRTLSLWQRNYGNDLPAVDMALPANRAFWDQVAGLQKKAFDFLDWADLRDGLRTACELSDFGNKLIADSEPWKLIKTDPAETKRILANLVYLVRDLAIMMRPFIPGSAEKLGAMLGISPAQMVWSNLAKPGPLASETAMQTPEILFGKLEDKLIITMRERFTGSQAERQAREQAQTKNAAPAKPAPSAAELSDSRSLEDRFADQVELRVARIVEIKRHPDAEKLYIETLDDGSGTPRTIVSGLVAHYREDELLNRHILVVANLKPAKLRGVLSQGMLLAASEPKPEGGESLEVVFAGNAQVGERVVLNGRNTDNLSLPQITIDQFFAIPLRAEAGQVKVGATQLLAGKQALVTHRVLNGEIG
jgi:methionyl-tRNA synthetase